MAKFRELVLSAIYAERELRKHSVKPRLTAGSIVSQCLEKSGAPIEKLNELRWALENKPAFMPNSRKFVRQVSMWFQGGHVSSGVPSDPSRMSLPSRDDAQLELAAKGYDLYLLWAIACQDVALRSPEVFGEIEDMDAWRERQQELKAKRDKLFTKIGQEFQPGDTITGEASRSDGSIRVFFKLAPEVSAYPLGNVGERLVTHLIDRSTSLGGTDPQAKVKEEFITD